MRANQNPQKWMGGALAALRPPFLAPFRIPGQRLAQQWMKTRGQLCSFGKMHVNSG